MTITQEELKKLLHYNPDTGVFTWLKARTGVKKNNTAGSIMTNDDGKSYYRIMCKGVRYFSHRLAWFYIHLEWPKCEIDHINGNGCDNRLINLRSVTRLENRKNRRKPSNNSSGISGVYWNKREVSWKVQISVNRKKFCLGTFDNIFDAVCARKNAEIKHGFHKNHGSDRPL